MLSLHGQSRGQEGGHMIPCKNCQHTHTVKNGFVRGKQRYQCRACGDNFVLGDERHSHATEVKKAW
jgi:transposase-like protein